MCRVERWNVLTLRKKIGGMLFEMAGLAKKSAKLAEAVKMPCSDRA